MLVSYHTISPIIWIQGHISREEIRDKDFYLVMVSSITQTGSTICYLDIDRKEKFRDFSDGPVVKTPYFHCRV